MRVWRGVSAAMALSIRSWSVAIRPANAAALKAWVRITGWKFVVARGTGTAISRRPSDAVAVGIEDD